MNGALTIAVIVSLGVAFVVLRVNPRRAINQGFFLISAGVAAWLMTLAQIDPKSGNILFWIRLANAEAAFLPWMWWMMKEAILTDSLSIRSLRRSWPWVLTAAALAALCFTPYFIPSESTPENPLIGPGRAVFNVVLAGQYIWLLIESIRDARSATGIRRVELQFLLGNGAAAGFVAITMNTLGVWLELPGLRRAQPLVIVIFYAVAAWGVTSRRVFDARQFFLLILRRGQVLIAVILVLVLAVRVYEWTGQPLVVILAAIAVLSVVEACSRWNLMESGVDRRSEAARREMLAIGRASRDWTDTEPKFCRVLQSWAHSEHVYLAVGAEGLTLANPLPNPLSEAAQEKLDSEGAITPEILSRSPATAAATALSDYLKANALGAMANNPTGPGSLSVTIAVSARHDHRPFTHVDIQFLKDAAGIIEGCLSRMLLTQQARDAEQLATVGLLGASLAHEIRNPLVTIKSVVQNAKDRYHDPGYRRLLTEVMPGEIERIEELLNGLMDLGRPRRPSLETVQINDLVKSTVAILNARAGERSVALNQSLAAMPDEIMADRSALRQVLLNLIINAVDALDRMGGRGVVTVRTGNAPEGLVLEVEDNGPGVPVDARRTLFRPFTRSAKTSGIGLGLAICADIIRSHHGEIKLVAKEGPGALFRVTIPCQPP